MCHFEHFSVGSLADRGILDEIIVRHELMLDFYDIAQVGAADRSASTISISQISLSHIWRATFLRGLIWLTIT
jgi:hypothetical protein